MGTFFVVHTAVDLDVGDLLLGEEGREVGECAGPVCEYDAGLGLVFVSTRGGREEGKEEESGRLPF